MNKTYSKAEISHAVDLHSLALWCQEQGFRLCSTRRGHVSIVPKSSYIGDMRREESQRNRQFK